MIAKLGRVSLFAVIATSVALEAIANDESPPLLSSELVERAEDTLRSAVTFFYEDVAIEGSYVWTVSADSTQRAGEAVTDDRQGWVQPPGTSSVGLAYIAAYQATGDPYYWQAALAAGHALVKTQLHSGGWNALMEFDEERRQAWCYRRDFRLCDAEGPRFDNRDRDASLLDDDITQSALRLLIELDEISSKNDGLPAIDEAASYALEKLLKAQYPNGAWPVRLDRRVNKSSITAKNGERARYPEQWSRQYVALNDPEFFVLNDHLMSNMIRTMLLAHHHYRDGRFLMAAMRAGDFLLAAQMPPPQPGWAQIYNSGMEPTWGRKFEPPALASWETAGTIEVLMDLYRYTGLERYRTAAVEAAAWLESVRIDDNLWARFYEMKTDKPLYMTSDYVLTYDDDDLPQHYGFQGDFGIPMVLETYQAMGDVGDRMTFGGRPTTTTKELATKVPRIIEMLDQDGRWLEENEISSATFVDHVETLAQALAMTSGRRLLVTPF